MALDASRILCMSQFNKTDIYALLDEGTQYRLVSFMFSQGSPEESFRTIGTATKQSLVEIRRPLDCYGRSTISSFVAIMPGTKDIYPNPTLNGIRIDFGTSGLFWKPVNVNAVYNEATAPTTSVLYDGLYFMHYLEGPTGQRLRTLARNSTGQFANIVTEVSSVNQTDNKGGEDFVGYIDGSRIRYHRGPSAASLTRLTVDTNANNNTDKSRLGTSDPVPMGGSDCKPGGLVASSLSTFYFLCEVIGPGTLGAGHVDIQDLPGGVVSWKQFLVHENSFRDGAYATFVGDYTENNIVTTRIISRWIGNGTVDLTLATPDNTIHLASPTPTLAPTPIDTMTSDSYSNLVRNVVTGTASAAFALISIIILYLQWAHKDKQKRLDSLQKVEDSKMSNATFAPPTGDELESDLCSNSASRIDETLLGHKLDDQLALSSMLLRPAPMFQPTAPPLPTSLRGNGSRASNPEKSRSFGPPPLYHPGTPVMEDIPLDQVQFSRHPRPNIMTRIE
ncbi:hypothetical protein BGZ82_009907 [Podila clonocystis]|nr:hypothetical protein BGZ82_009907 [Podila clonocystis]